MEDSTLRFRPVELESFARSILEGAGLESDHADLVARTLVEADLRGVDSHGVARIETYVRHLEEGGFNPSPDVTVERKGENAIAVDADDGLGQIASERTMDRLIDLSRESGVAVGVVRNSNHFGAAAHYTEKAAEDGCIGVAMTNVPPEVIPYGGTEPFLGTNPIAVSVPSPGEFPITMDMATSIVAMGKIDHVAAEKGESVPEDWGVDAEGTPTTDPNEIAALRTFGGPKGYCLSLIIDLLTGVLPGARQSLDVVSLYDDYDESMKAGHFFLAIDVDTLRDIDEFESHIGSYISRLKAIEPEEGVDEVLLPGEIEAKTMRRNASDGVPVNPNVFDGLVTLGDGYGVAAPEPVE